MRMANTLSLSHVQDTLDQRDPIFVLTLPFDQDFVKRYITERILHRTRRRWEWFVEAQRLDPGLGTLRYLPVEVRAIIWRLMLDCGETLSTDGLWEYDHTCGPIYDLSAYYFGFGRRRLVHDGFKNLRLVSSTLKAEYDESFLKHRSFRFNCAENLSGFLSQLKPASSHISIDIGICTLCMCTFFQCCCLDSFLSHPLGKGNDSKQSRKQTSP